MSKELKDSKRATSIVEIKPELFEILHAEYNETRPKPVNFTAYINGITATYIKRKALLMKKYPHLTIITSDPEVGLFIKDHKKDVVAEIELKLDSNNLIECKLDKSTKCDHYMYAILSASMMQMLPDSFLHFNFDTSTKKPALMV